MKKIQQIVIKKWKMYFKNAAGYVAIFFHFFRVEMFYMKAALFKDDKEMK